MDVRLKSPVSDFEEVQGEDFFTAFSHHTGQGQSANGPGVSMSGDTRCPSPPPGCGQGGGASDDLFSEQQERKPAFPAEIQPEHSGKTFDIRGNTIKGVPPEWLLRPPKWLLRALNLEELPPYRPSNLLKECGNNEERAKQWSKFLDNHCLQRGKDGGGQNCIAAWLKKNARQQRL
eukprot:g26402.t1